MSRRRLTPVRSCKRTVGLTGAAETGISLGREAGETNQGGEALGRLAKSSVEDRSTSTPDHVPNRAPVHDSTAICIFLPQLRREAQSTIRANSHTLSMDEFLSAALNLNP